LNRHPGTFGIFVYSLRMQELPISYIDWLKPGFSSQNDRFHPAGLPFPNHPKTSPSVTLIYKNEPKKPAAIYFPEAQRCVVKLRQSSTEA
jgi:hypothetical protein